MTHPEPDLFGELLHVWYQKLPLPAWTPQPQQPPPQPIADAFRMSKLLSGLFTTLDTLYWVSRRLPPHWAASKQNVRVCGGGYNVFVCLPLPPTEYGTVRAVISLSGDAEMILRTILGKYQPSGLEPSLQQLRASLSDFREIRNFFAHLDERLENPEHHGITGAAATDCGIQYGAGTRGNFHLVLCDDALHFSDHGIPKKVNVAKGSVAPVFDAVRAVYAALVALQPDPANFPPPSEIYPT